MAGTGYGESKCERFAMAGDRQATMVRRAQAAMNGLLKATRADDGASYLDPDIARQALVACLASILEPDARMKTRKDIREASDLAAR
jgi:hypothetical protein